MKQKEVEALLHKLNFETSYQGYPTTVYLIGLTVEHLNQFPRPTLLKLYQLTGEHFSIKPTQVSDNLKTMLDNFCNRDENLDRFRKIIGYRPDNKLTNKTFLFEVAAYLSRQK